MRNLNQRGYSAIAPRRDMYTTRPDHRVEYQIFGSEYFSNADVKIYIGDIWVDDATSIAFQLQEQVMPIYGYNSFTYDAVARGQRFVQGQFTVNFKNVGYLHQVLENANAIFYALEKGEQDGLVKPEYYENKTLSEILKTLGKDSFDQIADEYEKAIWGEKDSNELLSSDYSPYFRQDDFGFDLRVQYGSVSETSGYVQNNTYRSSKNDKSNLTVDMINGVQLTGMSKQISTADQGAPILEQYTFIARDVNGQSIEKLRR